MKTEQEAEIVPETPETTALAVRETQAVAPAVPEQAKPPVTAAQAKIEAVAQLTMKAYEKASCLTLTKEEIAALQADFPDDAFQPGAAGKENLIYIEHAAIRDRLNHVLGLGQWAIVPRSRWAEDYSFVNKYKETVQASRVYVEAMLLVRGAFVAEAVGEMTYYKNNESQNYGDAVEGAKTAALRRCAKELGVGLQAWKKEFCAGWWARRNAKLQVRAVPPAPKPTPVPAAPAKTPAERLAGLKAALGRNEGWAVGYLREHKLDGKEGAELMPNEGMDGLSAEKVAWLAEHWADFQNRLSQYIAENDDSGDYAPVKSTETPIAAVIPEALKQAEQIASGEFNPPWKEISVPFGKDKGKKFGDLEAKTLWYWFMVWGGKPLEPREYNGKMYPPTEKDQQVWQLLNSHKQEAISHYHFKEPKE